MSGAPSGTVIVRRLGPDDTATAVRTIGDLKHPGRPSAHGAAERMRIWLEDSDNILLAALDQERPVGFALGYLLDRVDERAQMLFFYEIDVVRAHRRQGIGAKLVESMKRIARAERTPKMWVQTDPENAAARALYEGTGAVASNSPDLIYFWEGEALRATQDR